MKKWIVYSLWFTVNTAWAGTCVVSPSTAVVTVGGTIQFSATGCTPIWSLASGSQGIITSTGFYSAQNVAYFNAQNFDPQSGCPRGLNDSVFNTDISALPIDSSSTARIANLFTVIGSSPNVTFQPTIPTNAYNSGTTTQVMKFRSTSQYDGTFPMLSTFTYRMEEASVISNDPSNVNQDHHVIGIDSSTCKNWEVYGVYPPGIDNTVPNSNSGSGDWTWSNNYFAPDGSGGGGIGVDAAGMVIHPLLLKHHEIRSGKINHALRMTLDNGNLFGHLSCTGFLWPAQACTNQCTDSTKCFPYGSRLRLKSTYGCSKMSAQGQAICQALKTYGAILVDGGTALAITSDWDSVESTQAYTAQFTDFTSAISSVASSDFDQVDESSLSLSSFTYNVNPSNAYVTPDHFIQVIAKDSVGGSISSTTVALQPVTVGWRNPAHSGLDSGINVMAGTPQFQIQTWAQGSTDTVATCTISPPVGTMTSDCKYTAPTSQYNQLLVTTVTVASEVDPNHNAVSFPLTVFSTDAIRVRMADAASGLDTQPPFDTNGIYVDATTGNKWFEEPANNLPPWNDRGTQGNVAWPNQMYNQRSYGITTDKLWAFMLPTCPTGACSQGTWIIQSNHGSNQSADVTASTSSFETQNGRILFSTVSLITATLTPGIFTSTVTISGNSLYYAMRANSNTSHNFISYFTISFSSATQAVAALHQPILLEGPLQMKGPVLIQ